MSGVGKRWENWEKVGKNVQKVSKRADSDKFP
jgi:hypothetical protein